MIVKCIEPNDIMIFLAEDLIAIKDDATIENIDNLVDFSNVNTTTLYWINPQNNNKQLLVESTSTIGA